MSLSVLVLSGKPSIATESKDEKEIKADFGQTAPTQNRKTQSHSAASRGTQLLKTKQSIYVSAHGFVWTDNEREMERKRTRLRETE